jgi:hypothetical protein
VLEIGWKRRASNPPSRPDRDLRFVLYVWPDLDTDVRRMITRVVAACVVGAMPELATAFRDFVITHRSGLQVEDRRMISGTALVCARSLDEALGGGTR